MTEVPRTSTDAKDTRWTAAEGSRMSDFYEHSAAVGRTDDILISVVVSVVTFVLWSVMSCQLVRSSYWGEKLKN